MLQRAISGEGSEEKQDSENISVIILHYKNLKTRQENAEWLRSFFESYGSLRKPEFL